MHMMRKMGYYLRIGLAKGRGEVPDSEELKFANESTTYLGGNKDTHRKIGKPEKKMIEFMREGMLTPYSGETPKP